VSSDEIQGRMFVSNRRSRDVSGDSAELFIAPRFCQAGSGSSPERGEATDSKDRNAVGPEVSPWGAPPVDWTSNDKRGTQSFGEAENQGRKLREWQQGVVREGHYGVEGGPQQFGD
jgi:hypothetical protein